MSGSEFREQRPEARRVRGSAIIRAQAALAPQPGSLPDNIREVGGNALVAVRRWADPRERELRRRRRVRRRSFQLGTVSGLTTAGTVGLVVISAPVWAVVMVGGGAVALVTGAALSTRRYLRLRGAPLPQAAFLPRKQPPLWSSARAPIGRLVRAEKALHGLGAQIRRSSRLPEDELADLLETAASGSAALHALAADITAMEQALGTMGRSNSPAAVALTENLRFTLGRLDAGVAEYEQVVAAAGRILAVPEKPCCGTISTPSSRIYGMRPTASTGGRRRSPRLPINRCPRRRGHRCDRPAQRHPSRCCCSSARARRAAPTSSRPSAMRSSTSHDALRAAEPTIPAIAEPCRRAAAASSCASSFVCSIRSRPSPEFQCMTVC